MKVSNFTSCPYIGRMSAFVSGAALKPLHNGAICIIAIARRMPVNS